MVLSLYINKCKTCNPTLSRLLAGWIQPRRLVFMFPYISLCKTCDLRVGHIFAPGPGHIWPWWYDLNKLGTVSQDDATLQISALVLMVSDKKIVYVFLIYTYKLL